MITKIVVCFFFLKRVTSSLTDREIVDFNFLPKFLIVDLYQRGMEENYDRIN